MNGLKRVTHRRDDALTRVGWDHLETLLAAYYRSEGYEVEHVGTGGTGARFDGGIDLKLRRGEQFIVVQCKHWNAMKVPHNAVHELLGLMVNHGATGAILATSGEFTKAAIEAAQRLGHVQLIDGDDLRAMLGPIREPASAFDSIRIGANDGPGPAFARRIGERLLSAAEDRIRHGGSGRYPHNATRSFATLVAMKLLAFALFAAFMVVMYFVMTRYIVGVLQPSAAAPQRSPAASPVVAAPVSQQSATQAVDPCLEIIDAKSGSYIDRCAGGPANSHEHPRDADAAIETIAESTPEM
ncbi:restriction endonuclease [Lysobacter panacisoli]|uniref:Restriction endonuclease type IV Mrr domain-containing protein n=1 Tax=Lysobacter panacisoli TaxID=1255263 RepID=A0ABP9LS14_9GAMM|nr:restriction endonuclease [Lysobacter panacisoli]